MAEETPAARVMVKDCGTNSVILHMLQGKENKAALQAGGRAATQGVWLTEP